MRVVEWVQMRFGKGFVELVLCGFLTFTRVPARVMPLSSHKVSVVVTSEVQL